MVLPARHDEPARPHREAGLTSGLDGVDFDDEYADYGTNGTGQPNAWSFPYLVQALRTDLPDSIISLYCIGPSSTTLSYDVSAYLSSFTGPR